MLVMVYYLIFWLYFPETIFKVKPIHLYIKRYKKTYKIVKIIKAKRKGKQLIRYEFEKSNQL